MNPDPKVVLSDRSVAYLEIEFRKGLESAEKEGWISEEEMRAKYRRIPMRIEHFWNSGAGRKRSFVKRV